MVFESSNVEIENCTVANSKIMGIRVYNSNYVTVKNSRAHNTQIGVLMDGGSNNILENVETWNNNDKGMEVNSDNTILRNIYNHNEPRSIISGNNNTLEYSRCENVEYGCWHVFADNSTIRHNDFFRLEFFGVNGGEVYNNTIGEFTIRDWGNKPSSFIKIYNNTIYSYLHNYFDNYRSDSIEIYGNYFYGMHGVLDRGGINTSVHNNFFNVSQFSIGFYNGATDSHAFSNEIHGTNAFFFGGTKNAVINNNIIEANTLAYYRGYWGNAENIISCNNTILAFNKSWDYDPDYNISLLNVMRIESDSCEPYVSIVSAEPVGFGSVKIGKESNATVPITIRSNMVNVSILVRGDSDFPDFPISSVAFLADKDKPYPVEEVQLERGVTKAVSVFLPSLTSTLHSLWKISVPSGIAAGSKQARATIFASIPQASDSRQLVLSLDAVPEVTPPPRLYQLSPIAGMLAYILLPMVFALVAQKYLLGEVEFTVQGLIKYLLLFIMVIIIAIGFALVFSII
jgi:parallel beta-helix repeat protein